MIEHVYYINLKKNTAKSARMEKELGKIGMPKEKISRWEAVSGREYTSVAAMVHSHQGIRHFQPSFFVEEKVLNNPRYRGKIGCWLSHSLLLEKYENSSSRGWLVIMEDDIVVHYGMPMLRGFMSETIRRHDNPDVIVLGDRIGIAGRNIQNNLSKFPGKKTSFGLDSYSVFIPSIPKFLKYLRLDTIQSKCSLDNKFADLNQGIIKIVPLEGPPLSTNMDPQSLHSDIEIAR